MTRTTKKTTGQTIGNRKPDQIIIGLAGKKQSGKNTVADMLSKLAAHEGWTVKQFAFAYPVKRELADACDVTVDYVEKHKDMFRLGLQWWGTEFRRAMHGDKYWVKQLNFAMQQEGLGQFDKHVYIVTDVRFKNEADYIQKLGGLVVRVERPETLTWRDWLPWNIIKKSRDNHASETDLDNHPFRAFIVNNGTIEKLKENVSRFWKLFSACHRECVLLI